MALKGLWEEMMFRLNPDNEEDQPREDGERVFQAEETAGAKAKK